MTRLDTLALIASGYALFVMGSIVMAALTALAVGGDAMARCQPAARGPWLCTTVTCVATIGVSLAVLGRPRS